MAIPEFQENGLLPPGMYLATLDEIETKLGQAVQRRALYDRLTRSSNWPSTLTPGEYL